MGVALGPQRLSILIVEDNPADADLVRDLLRDADLVTAGTVSPEIHHVETLRGALTAAKKPFDVALLDLGLPDASGLEGLHALSATVPQLPAVVLTGTRDPVLAERAIYAGAQDFLVKGDVEGQSLLRALRFAVARQRGAASHQRPQPASTAASAQSARGRGVQGDRSPRRVLLVEDNPGDAELLQIALADASTEFAVGHVERLRDALALSPSDIDVVLLDLSLPDAAGVECIERMRSSFPELPVIVITGTASVGDEALRAGAQDYISKNELRARDLQRAINYAFERNAHNRRVQELAAERARHAATQAHAQALREADEQKNHFLATLSHELRNPLAPIRNSSYILRHAEPGSEQARRAQSVIERQTEHLTRLVDDLLDVTRIVRGKVELRRTRVDLREVVSRAADDFRMLLLDRGVELRVELPEAGVFADADATRVTQVLGNLLHNAAKFTRRGDTVAVSLAPADGAAEIRIRDTGAGIDPELIPRIFEPFVQGDRTLARTEGGLGLGLALVKGIAEMHGGAVRANSAGNGHGAEFVVRLPLADCAATQPEARAVVTPSNAGRRILVVDDNPGVAESLADLVRILGHVAEVAYDGPSAIEKARTLAPSIVLCEIGLPGMSGYEVVRALRAEGAPGMKLFAVSGYAQPEDVKRAIEAGFDGHVAKPAGVEQIERLLS